MRQGMGSVMGLQCRIVDATKQFMLLARSQSDIESVALSALRIFYDSAYLLNLI